MIVWEADEHYVGGISRTVQAQGFRFDIGGHRFFSKSEEVNKIWHEIMPSEFLECPRLSRIYYKGKFFNYPLEAIDSFRKLGLIESIHILVSYLKARMKPIHPETSFAQWVTNRFGKRLYQMFFKSYTEKVWGISCDEISADWAAQRIKGLSLRKWRRPGLQVLLRRQTIWMAPRRAWRRGALFIGNGFWRTHQGTHWKTSRCHNGCIRWMTVR